MSSTADLLDRLRRHYIKPGLPLPGGIFVPEVGQNGSWGLSHRCDAIYVGFTSTSGRLLVGHELKVSRADWQHELDQSGKADQWHDVCHEWWVVAPSTDIVDPDTLPAGWGLMVPSTRTKTRMDRVVKARRREDLVPPWWAVRSVMARYDTLRSEAIQKAHDKVPFQVQAEVERRLSEQARFKTDTMTPRQRQDLDTVEAFRKAGIELSTGHGWGENVLGLDDLLPLVGLVRDHRGIEHARAELTNRWGGVGAVLASAQKLVKAVEALAPDAVKAAS